MAQWIKSDINIDFVGRRKKFWSLSAAVVVLSIVMLPVNYFVRGAVLNYGTDFRGGSQIQIEFSKKGIATSKVRAALDRAANYKNAEVVKMQGRQRKTHFFLLRLTEVSSPSDLEQNRPPPSRPIERLPSPAQLKKFDYKRWWRQALHRLLKRR
jgi:preprotein translocase subunit SecF